MSSLGQFFARSSEKLRPGAGTPVVAVTVALLSWSGRVAAQSEAQQPSLANLPERVELKYAAGQGCPADAAFVNEVAARIRRPIEWVTSSAATQILVTVGQADGHATGRLEVVRPSSGPTRREFVASTCDEVGSALALVTALTLDPDARTDPLPPPVIASSPAPAVVVPVPPAPPAEPAPAPRQSGAGSPPPPVAPERPAPPALRSAVWLGPVVGVAAGYAPQALVTYGTSLGAKVALRPGFSPTIQLTPLWGKTGSTGPAAAAGTFSWALARLEACPTDLRLLAALVVEPCVAGEVGRLGARGAADRVEQSVTADRWWGAAGLTLALHLSVGRWFTRWGAQALFPLTRDEFVFRSPDEPVHRASVLVAGASLAVGFQVGP